MFKLKKVATSIIGCGLLITTSTGVQAASDSAIVNIKATVVDNTCTPEWDTAGVTVNMDRVSLKDFKSKVGKTQDFTLSLKDCGVDTTSVKVTMKGDSDTTDNTLLKNTVSDGAKGVGIGIWGDDNQSTQLTPDANNSVTYSVAQQKADLTFEARLMQTGDVSIEPGEVVSTATFTVSYD